MKITKVLLIPFKLANVIVMAVFKTVFMDLFVNFKYAWLYAFNPEEREKMKRKLESEKMVNLLKERIEILERLLYSVFEDPSYTKSDKGKYDLKKLKEEAK
ncbi:MAG: hypothetical protein Q8O03_01325 [Nanoarchaeota archaeon]|jgi:hypothetical protein|nr:hypothetical protein [Nanoarchaeota archaeon]